MENKNLGIMENTDKVLCEIKFNTDDTDSLVRLISINHLEEDKSTFIHSYFNGEYYVIPLKSVSGVTYKSDRMNIIYIHAIHKELDLSVNLPRGEFDYPVADFFHTLSRLL